MPSIYRPRRPRASPLWQIVHHAWGEFRRDYDQLHRATHGPLRPHAAAVVHAFHRCGDLSAGFTRFQCPDCGHERLLAFTCKGRYFCPACHQRRVRAGAWWIAHHLCHPLPHRQFVFTMPRPLRGIFRKRRDLLTLLFHTALGCLRDWFRARLDLPDGKIAAVAAVQTFGDYLVFHPHLHVLAATGLFDARGRFHLLPVESLEPLADLFRHRFLAVLRKEKLISEKKLRQLIERIWGVDPLICPSCKGTMRRIGTIERPEEISFFLRLHGLWEGVLDIPPPPKPPYNVETMAPIDPPPQWSWRDESATQADPIDQSTPWRAPELPLDDERILVLDAETPPEEWRAN